MSDLGAIFHVKKDGVQYDAHAYTTLDECPEPNLKLTYKGQQAYVKLEAKGSGDVPCYVKNKAGNTYQVRKEALPTGSSIVCPSGITFTVPSGIKVLKINSPAQTEGWGDDVGTYIGVTPNSVYKLVWREIYGETRDAYQVQCTTHNRKIWATNYDYGRDAKISWSPKINKHKVDITDY